MIRRITRNNDYKDIIKSCPEGVIDYVYRVDYYVSGHPEVFVQMTPVKVGEHLEVVLSTEALANLTYNGVLMRRAYYSQADPDYPDDSYDLEFVDNMNVWLGEEDTVTPFDPGYLTEDDLKTINGESIVGEGNIEISVPDYYATKSWVSDQGYLTEVPSGYVTESWVSSQQFATQSWVSAQGYITSTGLSGLATISWVESQNYLTSVSLTGYATESWVSSNYVSTTTLSSYTTFTDIDSYISSFWYRAAEEFYSDYVPRREIGSYLSGYATESWVESQGYITSVPSEYATQSWVSSNFLSTTALTGYATEDWVTSNIRNFVTEENVLNILSVNSYATESWVSSNFLSSTALTGYATESWVSEQGFLTSVPNGYALSSWVREYYAQINWVSNNFATQSWATSQFFEESKIWTGTSSQWDALTSEQQAFYTIALVTE